jgi:hypothetical protein
MSKVIDLTGESFNRLTVLKQEVVKVSGRNRTFLLCSCSCGNTSSVEYYKLIYGHTKSCGCLLAEQRLFTTIHGCANKNNRPYEYTLWRNIKDRCFRKENKDYIDYGGRGISLYDGWVDSFIDFYRYIGERPSKLHSLDRIDNSKGYEPGNVRWATQKDQCRNKRNNVILTVNGESLCLTEWAEKLGVSLQTLSSRYCQLGWDAERTINTPVRSMAKWR